MYGKAKTARIAMASTGTFACQLRIKIKGAAFRVDGLTNA